MSSFFSKNRQSSQPVWQKKQTAVNSHNDKFTIYAHMHPSKSKSILYTQNSVYPHAHTSQLTYEDRQGSQVPINHKKISKMKQKLKNLQLLNNNQCKFNVSTQLRHYSNPNSVQNSRNVVNNNQLCRQIYDQQPYPQKHNDPNNFQQQNYQQRYVQPQEIAKLDKRDWGQGQSQNGSIERSRYERSQPSSKISYNDKLDIMKQRLALICKKQFAYKTESPTQNYHHKKQLSYKPSNKNMLQVSTKRQNYYQVKRQKDYAQLLGKLDKNSQLYKQFRQMSSNNSSTNLHKSKNTVPMPKIIHEDAYEGQQYTKISATMQYPPSSHFQQNNTNIRHTTQRQRQLQLQHQYQMASKLKLSNHVKQNADKLSLPRQDTKYKKQIMSNNKKQPDHYYYYWDLYPNMSEQLDNKIEKQRKNQQNRLNMQYRQTQHQRNNNKYDRKSNKKNTNEGLNHVSKSNHNLGKPNSKYIKNANNYDHFRVSQGKDQGRYAGQQAQLDNLKNSVWLGVYPTYNQIHQKYNKSINEGYNRGSFINHSNLVTKRRDSSNSVYIPPASKLITKKQYERQVSKSRQKQRWRDRDRQRSNTSRSLSRSTNKNQTTSQTNINAYRNRSNTSKQNIKKLYNMQAAQSQNNAVIKFGNKRQPQSNSQQYKLNIIAPTHPEQQSCNPQPLNKPHRAMIKQIIIGTSTNLNQNQIQLYTASNDYTVKYHIHNEIDSSINSWELYRHRGCVNALMKIDNMLFSVGNDLYLKYCKVNNSNNSALTQNQYMYRMQTKPMHLSCIDQTTITVGCHDRLVLFDIVKCKSIRDVFLDYNQTNYSLLQNGPNLYIGDSQSLYLFDYRSMESLVRIVNNLGHVDSWIMHPIQQLFIIQKQNKLIQLQFKSTKKYIDKNFLINLDTIQLGTDKRIVSSCWRTSTIPEYNSNYTRNGTLALLFQQDNINPTTTMTTTRNQLIQWTISCKNNDRSMLKQVSMGRYRQYVGTISNCMSIVREWNGRYYMADRNGNLYNFISMDKQNPCTTTAKKANASIQRKRNINYNNNNRHNLF